jgi:hypothetical protein
MASFHIRDLHCLSCDEPIRVRNEVIGGREITTLCPGCNGQLVCLGDIDLEMPDIPAPRIRIVIAIDLSQFEQLDPPPYE